MTRRTAMYALLGLAPIIMSHAGCSSRSGVDCYWELSVTNDTEISGNRATFQSNSQFEPGSGEGFFFQISLFGGNNPFLPAGLILFVPGESDFEVVMNIAVDGRIWSVTDEDDGTTATVFSDGEMTSEVLETRISGTCQTVIDEETVFRPFTLRLRAARGDFGSPGCTGG